MKVLIELLLVKHGWSYLDGGEKCTGDQVTICYVGKINSKPSHKAVKNMLWSKETAFAGLLTELQCYFNWKFT